MSPRVRLVLLFVLLAAALGVWLWIAHLETTYWSDEPYHEIEPYLYMGKRVPEPPPGTQAVLNLCFSKDPYSVAVERWEPIKDAAPAPDIDWLRRQVDFVAEQHQQQTSTYVHCMAGVSRSGLVVAAYLMYKHGWSRDRALEHLRSKRPQVKPNPAFMKLLEEWERQLTSSNQLSATATSRARTSAPPATKTDRSQSC